MRAALEIDAVLAEKTRWLDRYKEALARLWPETVPQWSVERLALAASSIMDSLLFAGGVSVPSVISFCFGLLWSQWGVENLPKGFQLRESNLHTYLLETIRRFPPVAGFFYAERSF